VPLFQKIVVGVILAYLFFEFIEHAIFPLAWLILKKKRKYVTDPLGLMGEVGEIREWGGNEGRIFVHGSIWAATGDYPFTRGDKAEVLDVEGLVLRIKPITR
jgi:membrane-bound ClpP family serine protease